MRFGVHISASFEADDIDHARTVLAVHILQPPTDFSDNWTGDIDIYPEYPEDS